MTAKILRDKKDFPYYPFVENYILQTKASDIPDHVFHQAKRCLLDLIGVLIAGSTTELGRIINDHAARHFAASDHESHHGATLLGDGRQSSAVGVALAGGMTIDAIDAHDGMRLVKGHAGCGLLPALLGILMDRPQDFNDDDLLTSLVLGYEIAIRAGITLHQSVPDYHTSGAWVALGTAALTSRLRGHSPELLREAMGIAEYHGPRSQMMRTIDHPTMVKDGSGWGAMAGVSAGLLAEDGFTGAPAITVTGENEAPIWQDLGEVWHIIDQYIKPWPVCRWAQPAATAALDVMHDNNLLADDIAHIKIISFHQAVRLATRIPYDTEAAQYSLPWPVAAAVIRGTIGTREVSAPFTDPDIKALALSMTLEEDDAHNNAFPAERIARVVLTTKDGHEYTSEDTRATWDPEDAPSDEDMITKFHRLADPVIGGEKASQIKDLVFDLDPRNQQSVGARALVEILTSNFNATSQS